MPTPPRRGNNVTLVRGPEAGGIVGFNSMRSQANSARLMEQNPTLMRLREIEALEKVAEKGRLSVVVGLAGRVVRV